MRSPLALAAVSSLVALAAMGVAGTWRAPQVIAAAHADVASALSLPLERSRLDNGLELFLLEGHRTPIVSVDLWYHVGSKDEERGKNGFAHLFEHLMFQGSKHVPEDTYFRDLERVGASDVNGTTNEDRTNYYETVPSNRLELALWLESDRMGFLLDHVDQLTFAGQRDVVKNERRQHYENAPYGMVPAFIHAAIYPEGHPYHDLTIGTPQDLDAATLADVKSFFSTWYVPDNASLVIAGDIDRAKTKELVAKYFGPIPRGAVPDRAAQASLPLVTLTAEKKVDVAAGVELPRVYIAWPTPRALTMDDGRLDLLARVLSEGKTSRLYKRLVYDMQIAKDVSASQASHELGSLFTIVATAQQGHTADELRAAIDLELATLRASGVRNEELARARTTLMSDMIFELEPDSARADRVNYYNQDAGDPEFLSKDAARYQTATAADVAEVLRRWLPEGKRLVLTVSPVKGAPACGQRRDNP